MKLNELPGLITESVERLVDRSLRKRSQPGRFLRTFPTEKKLQLVDGIRQGKWLFVKTRPYINVQFEGDEQSFVPVDLIPMLVVGSRYENTKRIPNRDLEEIGFRVVEEPEPNNPSGDEHWFCFRTEAGFTVQVRQLELARALFFHNFHLSRTAFRHNGLSGLGWVDHAEDATTIRVSELADFPFSNLHSRSSVVHFAWMFLDEGARQSFGSILSRWMQSDCKVWSFNFSPPLLKTWSISCVGVYEKGESGEIFTIEEITRLHNPVFAHEKRIVVDHPYFKEALGKTPENGKRPTIPDQSDVDPELVLDHEPLLGSQLEQASDPGFVFSCDDNLEVSVQVNGKRYRVKPRIEGKAASNSLTTSPGHAGIYGRGREFDYGINRNDDRTELSSEEVTEIDATNRLDAFNKVVEQLGRRADFRLEKKIFFLLPGPKGKDQKEVKTKDGRGVQCCVAVVQYKAVRVAIFEVDVANIENRKSMSTLIVVFNDQVLSGIKSVLQRCSLNEVRWDLAHLKSVNAEGQAISHPPRYRTRIGQRFDHDKWVYESRWLGILERNIARFVRSLEKS